MLRHLLIAVAFLMTVGMPSTSAPMEENKDDVLKPSTEPKNLPLELKIINNALEAYDVDARGDPFYKFQENIRKRERSGTLLFATQVEMELEIKNTGIAPIQILISSESTQLVLDLTGNGAMTAHATSATSRDPVVPQPVTINPGKSYKMALTSLASTFRNQTTHCYVTEAGLYQLSVKLRTGIFPPPKNATHMLQNGFGEVLLKSAPIEFRAIRPS